MTCNNKIRQYSFQRLQQDSNPQPFSLEMNSQPFIQTGQMIDLCAHNTAQSFGQFG